MTFEAFDVVVVPFPFTDRTTKKRRPALVLSDAETFNKLIAETQQIPCEGIGKPEPLKENLSGFWSRRIDEFNRLVCIIDSSQLTIISCRYHYEK